MEALERFLAWGGVKRDVTAYLIPPADAIQAGDTSVTLKYGKGLTMYQNHPDGNGGMVSKLTTSPTLKVDIRVDSGTRSAASPGAGIPTPAF